MISAISFAAYSPRFSFQASLLRLRAYFFCLPKRNRRKKRAPDPCPFGVPCASRNFRGSSDGRGPAGMPALFRRDRDIPSEEPRWRREAQSSRRPGPRGVLLFGYFLLDKQEKVPRGRFTKRMKRLVACRPRNWLPIHEETEHESVGRETNYRNRKKQTPPFLSPNPNRLDCASRKPDWKPK